MSHQAINWQSVYASFPRTITYSSGVSTIVATPYIAVENGWPVLPRVYDLLPVECDMEVPSDENE